MTSKSILRRKAIQGALSEVQCAIAESISFDRVVEVPRNDENHVQLLCDCDGHDSEGTFWGIDVHGRPWTVRLEAA